QLVGDRRLFLISQLASLYTILCWVVALFIYSLLVHSTHYEFDYFNGQVQKMTSSNEFRSDDDICDYLLKLMKIHTRLTECVNHLD
ncbi:hypothetical protein PMAYCL1PPCAC_31472, partial [Pristionchus mayeri]